jgi:hypothetical protein
MRPAGVLTALCLTLATPAAARACDWAVPNDVFSMAETAPRISVVRALDFKRAEVIRDLKGQGPKTITTGNTNCDPFFDEPGATYLLFHRGKGESVSDSSSARLLGDSGQNLIAAVTGYMNRPAKSRDSFLEVQVHNVLLWRKPRLSDYRLVQDAITKLGTVPPAVKSPYETLVQAQLRRTPKTWDIRAKDEILFARAEAAAATVLLHPDRNGSAAVSRTLKGTAPVKIVLPYSVYVTPGEPYLAFVDGTGKLVDQDALVRATGKRGRALVRSFEEWFRTKKAARRSVVERLLQREGALAPYARFCDQPYCWRPMLDSWLWLMDQKGPLEPATCKAIDSIHTSYATKRLWKKWKRARRSRCKG